VAREGNKFIGVNYIDDNENMEVPPEFWLQRLYDFDSALVVFPSRYRPAAYVLARRQHFSAGMRDEALEKTVTQPDTKLCLERHLVPVTLIFRTGVTWTIDNIIAQLKARDVWAHGGYEKVANLLDDQDVIAEAAKATAVKDDMWARSGDAWKSYQARTGQSTIRHNDTRTAQPRKGRRIYSNSPSGSTAGSGPVTLT
jgi:hypothetical protein